MLTFLRQNSHFRETLPIATKPFAALHRWGGPSFDFMWTDHYCLSLGFSWTNFLVNAMFGHELSEEKCDGLAEKLFRTIMDRSVSGRHVPLPPGFFNILTANEVAIMHARQMLAVWGEEHQYTGITSVLAADLDVAKSVLERQSWQAPGEDAAGRLFVIYVRSWLGARESSLDEWCSRVIGVNLSPASDVFADVVHPAMTHPAGMAQRAHSA